MNGREPLKGRRTHLRGQLIRILVVKSNKRSESQKGNLLRDK